MAICENVYFQPPETVKLKYPCIIYTLDRIETRFADDRPYRLENRYSVLYICKDPDDMTKYTIASLEQCSFERAYTADNLYHYAYKLYY